MLRTTAIAWTIVALVMGVAENAAASAKKGRASTGGCAGAYVIPGDGASSQQASDAVLCLVNRERASRGLRAVRAAKQLTSAAAGHSADMVTGGYFSHVDPNGDGVAQRVSRTGYPWMAIGETLAWGAGKQATPSRLVAAFMTSPEHRPIVLGNYRDIGVGLTLGSPGGNVPSASTLTLDFGSR